MRPHSGIPEPRLTVTAPAMLQPCDRDPSEKSKQTQVYGAMFAPANIADMGAVWKEANPMK